MTKIGFDFGTTNSTISFLLENSDGTYSLESFKIDAVEEAIDYIPSVIAYSANGSQQIGKIAKRNLNNRNIEAYENFKLDLGDNFDKVYEGKTKNKTPTQVTMDYINNLLRVYISNMSVSSLEEIVMTVPTAWYGKPEILNNIEYIYIELGYSNCVLKSEPEAAAAFFCHCYEEGKAKAYDGDILVIDYGGGTLDVV